LTVIARRNDVAISGHPATTNQFGMTVPRLDQNSDIHSDH
jgi:hypothetical protein